MRMRVFSQNLSLENFLTIGPYEEDEGFRELLRTIAQKGLFIYGLLGVLIIIFFVSSHIFFVGKTVAWSYVDLDSRTEMLLLDKITIFLFCSSMMLLSRTSISLKSIRILVFVMVWLICIFIPIEDIAGRDTSFTIVYNTIALLFAVGTVPFRGWHTALLSGIVIVFTFLALALFPILMELPAPELRLGQIIFIFVVAFLLTGMSSQIYLNRYEQYRAQKKAEALSKKLEERNLVLQALKEKADRQAEQLRENEKLKDRFFANISHEFRTPLTLILGPLKDMLDEGLDKGSEKTLEEKLGLMYRNGQKLLGLINQLLELSKIDSGKIYLQKERVFICEFISEVVSTFGPMAESREISLTVDSIEAPLVAEIDKEMMERAISNLVSNAIKFTEEGGEVTVSIEQKPGDDRRILIRVSDTGIGIPEKELSNIFDRFYQVSHSSHNRQKGTGIGLAFSKEIIELHDGALRAASIPGEGSEFTVEMPGFVDSPDGMIATSPDKKTVADKVVSKPEETVTRELFVENLKEDAPTVMVIDDNPDILEYLKPHLSERYGVLLHTDSAKALELVEQKKIDLIISDVMMPDPDGFEVCRAIKESDTLNHIPVILLTAQAEEESKIEGLELGADDYISKPFSASELMIRVENLIELRNMLRDKYSQQVRIKGKEVEVSSDDARFLQEVQTAIEEHMANSNFGVDWLADEVNLSSRQLQRKIRSITNLSAGGYIRLLRLERASQLLAQEWGNVSEVAYEVGFQDARYFSKLFKQTFGSTPTEYVSDQD